LRLKPHWQNRLIILTGKSLWLTFRLCCDLTPSVPLSFDEERGKLFFEEGLTPLLDTPYEDGELKRGFASLILIISPSPC